MRRVFAIVVWGVAAVLAAPTLANQGAGDAPPVRLDGVLGDIPAQPNLIGQDVDSPAPGELQVFSQSLPPAFLEPTAIDDATSNSFSEKTFVGAALMLAGDFHLRLEGIDRRPAEPGLAVLSDLDQLQVAQNSSLDQTHSVIGAADWDFASWGGLSLFASRRAGGTVSLDNPVRLEFPGSKYSTMIGVSAHLNFGDGWVTSFSYDEARTQFDLSPNAMGVQDSEGFGLELSKKGLIDEDTLNIAVIRPPPSTDPAVELALGGSDARLLGSQISLSSATPETDFELGYETSFNGNITLQANAAYQMNVAGQNGTKGVTVLSRAKINF